MHYLVFLVHHVVRVHHVGQWVPEVQTGQLVQLHHVRQMVQQVQLVRFHHAVLRVLEVQQILKRDNKVFISMYNYHGIAMLNIIKEISALIIPWYSIVIPLKLYFCL